MKNLKNLHTRAYAKFFAPRLGWKTPRNIVVIESDDWGSARIPNIESQRRYLKANPKAANCPYLSYDCLEGDDDLEALGSALLEFSDNTGRPAKVTANYNVANPDFDKIRESGFQNYFYEPFTKTLAREGRTKSNIRKIHELISAGIWSPQSHGREHIHIPRWMAALTTGAPEILAAFENRIYGVSLNCAPSIRHSILASFDYDTEPELTECIQTLQSGLTEFKELFGFHPSTFIPPNYVFAPLMLNRTSGHRLRGLQGLQLTRPPHHDKITPDPRVLGREEATNVRSLIRNVQFEPSLTPNVDWVDRALAQTKRAFDFNKPAVICSHRLNYMGGIEECNRSQGLNKIRSLLEAILRNWPDVEFLSSNELIEQIYGITNEC